MNGLFYLYSTPKMIKKSITTLLSSISILFAGIWLVIRIILEYFGIISDGNDRTTGIKDLRDEYKKANYR
jgi:hypothetical protein